MKLAGLACCLLLARFAWAETSLPLVDLASLAPLPARPSDLPEGSRWFDDDWWFSRTRPAPDRSGVYTLRSLARHDSPAPYGDGYQLWWRPVDGPPHLMQQRRVRQPDGPGGLIPDVSVSPDGLWVAWSSQDGERTRIELQHRDRATTRVLAEGTEATDVDSPLFAPDGRSVLYVRERDDDGVCLLRRADLDGRNDRLFLAHAEPYGGWSPDGRSFAYHVERSLRVFEPAGGTDRVVVKDRAVADEPNALAWSPDGHWISFVGESRREANEPRADRVERALFVVAATGGEPRELVPCFQHYTWLPDSSGLLCAGPADLAGAVPGSGALTQIIDLEGRAQRVFGLPERVFAELAWAPDSGSLVAVAATDIGPDDLPGIGRRRAFAVSLDGAVRPLTEPGVWAAQPTTAGLLTLVGQPDTWVGCGPAELRLGGEMLLRGEHLRSISATPDGRRVAVVQGLPGAARVLVGPHPGRQLGMSPPAWHWGQAPTFTPALRPGRPAADATLERGGPALVALTGGAIQADRDDLMRPVPNVPADTEFATLSPDGGALALVTAGRRLAVMAADGSGYRLLPDRLGSIQQPVWLPDGQSFLPALGADVAWSRAAEPVRPPRDTHIGLPRSEPDPGEPTTTAVPAALSPDGHWLASIHRGEIWLLATRDGSQPRCLAGVDAKPVGTLLWPARPANEGNRP